MQQPGDARHAHDHAARRQDEDLFITGAAGCILPMERYTRIAPNLLFLKDP
nr:hypothetical protein [Pseudomonas sp. Marseille-Q3773]